jgi:hypothetical protein
MFLEWKQCERSVGDPESEPDSHEEAFFSCLVESKARILPLMHLDFIADESPS